MLIRLAEGRMFLRTPAKVNLFLEVLRKRPDGYHDLATLMLAVSLYDTLEIQECQADEVRLECDQAGLSTGPDNLVVRAAQLVRERFGIRKGLQVRLWKRIPLAAGLAGGSSDAAAMLAGLNRLWRLGLDQDELIRLGGELGSDVSFFFAPPAAWCTGRGEVVQPVPLGRPLDLVLVCPPVGLSTAQVFGRLKVPEGPEDGSRLRQAVTAGDVEELGRRLHNRLQPTAEELCPAVAEWCQRLAGIRPVGQLMTGSGSTVFALARDSVDALRITRQLCSLRDEGVGCRVFVVRSCD
jgi:4-diphosphocytidyl-2-C-methyl-D-erythritol kinase